MRFEDTATAQHHSFVLQERYVLGAKVQLGRIVNFVVVGGYPTLGNGNRKVIRQLRITNMHRVKRQGKGVARSVRYAHSEGRRHVNVHLFYGMDGRGGLDTNRVLEFKLRPAFERSAEGPLGSGSEKDADVDKNVGGIVIDGGRVEQRRVIEYFQPKTLQNGLGFDG